MAVARKNFEVVPGQALNFTLIYSGITGSTGATAPIDLSGYTASAIFTSPDGATLLSLAEVGATGAGIYKVPALGYLRIGITQSDLAKLSPKANYRVFVQNNSDLTDKPCLSRGAVIFTDG